MLPASNRGAGSSLNFPDVCKTPAPPLPFMPVPYPDMGLNMQAAPFSPNVMVGFMPATNMGTMKVMTNGDEAGAMGGLLTGAIKGPGRTTMGNPIVFISGLPAESLLTPTSGNNMNAPLGVQLVPSVVNVFYTYRDGPASSGLVEPTCALPPSLDCAELRALGDVARGEGESAAASRIEATWLSPGLLLVRLGLFSAHADRELFNTLSRFAREGLRACVLDLRGNRGGDGAAALRLVEAWLPEGAVMLLERDGEGDDEPILARGAPCHEWPLCVLVDEGSASAAELVAATLQFHGRATVVGRPTYGKGTAQEVVRMADGAMRYVTACEYRLPNGAAIDGCGVVPDVVVARTSEEPHHGHLEDPDVEAARAVLERA